MFQLIVFVLIVSYNSPIKNLIEGEKMIPIPVCIQIIAVVATVVAGKEILSKEDE